MDTPAYPTWLRLGWVLQVFLLSLVTDEARRTANVVHDWPELRSPRGLIVWSEPERQSWPMVEGNPQGACRRQSSPFG